MVVPWGYNDRDRFMYQRGDLPRDYYGGVARKGAAHQAQIRAQRWLLRLVRHWHTALQEWKRLEPKRRRRLLRRWCLSVALSALLAVVSLLVFLSWRRRAARTSYQFLAQCSMPGGRAHELSVPDSLSVLTVCGVGNHTERRLLPAFRPLRRVALEALLFDMSRNRLERVPGTTSSVERLTVDGGRRDPAEAWNALARCARGAYVLLLPCDALFHLRSIRLRDLSEGVVEAEAGATTQCPYAWPPLVVRRDRLLVAGGLDERIGSEWSVQELHRRLRLPHGDVVRWPVVGQLRYTPHWERAGATDAVWEAQRACAAISEMRLAAQGAWNAQLAQMRSASPSLYREALTGWFEAAAEGASVPSASADDSSAPAHTVACALHDVHSIPWQVLHAMNEPQRIRLLTELERRANGHTAPVVVFADVRHGLGNRLRAYASARAFARMIDAVFVLVWIPDRHMNAEFHDLFQNDELVLRQPVVPWPPHAAACDPAWQRVELVNYMEPDGYGARKYRPVSLERTDHLYFRSAYMMDAQGVTTKAFRALTLQQLDQLQPVAAVRARLQRMEHDGLRQMIGVHIRHAPPALEIGEMDVTKEYDRDVPRLLRARRRMRPERFARCIQPIAAREPHTRFLVAADDPHAIVYLQQRFPDRVYTQALACGGRDVRCLQSALADLLALGRTRYILGSEWSSFSEVAAYIGRRRLLLSTCQL